MAHNPNPEKGVRMSEATVASPPTESKHRRVARARRGSGSLFQPRRRDGTIAPTFWSKIYVNGRPVRESTGTTDREAAEGVLRDRLTRASQGLPVGRMQSEVLTLERRHVDLTGGRLTLHAGVTKNDAGREVFLTPPLKAALAAQLERVDALQRQLERVIPFVFPHLRGRHRGKQILDF